MILCCQLLSIILYYTILEEAFQIIMSIQIYLMDKEPELSLWHVYFRMLLASWEE